MVRLVLSILSCYDLESTTSRDKAMSNYSNFLRKKIYIFSLPLKYFHDKYKFVYLYICIL